MKVRSLKNRMSSFNEVVAGLKEGKQEMSKQVRELEAAVDALMAKIKVGDGGGGANSDVVMMIVNKGSK